MSENPFQAPQADTQIIGVKSGKQEDVRAVAVYQKGILVCILIQLVAIAGQFALPADLRLVAAVPALCAGLAGTVFVFLLSTKIYSTGIGVLLGILTFLPCIGLIVLLVVNGKATKILQQNGHKVGLLGASLAEF